MRLLRLPIVTIVLLGCLLVAGPSASAAALAIVDPITDNYKASYNADPSQPELRTWLSIVDLSAGGTTWRPSAPGSIAIGDSPIELVGADGRTASLAAGSTTGPIASLLTRADPTASSSGGRWGLLITLSDRAALRTSPVTIELTLTSGGAVLATGRVEYRYDAALAGVASGHLEYNGPGGRWYVGGVATRTEWAPAPSTRPTLVAASPPRITSVVVPARTSRRTVIMRVTGRAGSARITHLRVSVAGRAYSRWVRIAPRYSLVLPRGNALRSVRVQLLDANRLRSGVVTRRVRCICG